MQAILTDEFRNQQYRLKLIREKLQVECQKLDEKISKQLLKLQETSRIISQQALTQTKIYKQSLDSQEYSSEVVDLATLSKYLKNQKAYLSNLISSSNQKQNMDKSGRDLLHKLSNRKKFEKYLQHLQCVKLQNEIQYLQKHIIKGQNKRGLQKINYEDIESVTIKEENQQVQKLKISLEQLERILNLSNQCGGNLDSSLSNNILQLNRQAQRLQRVEQILDRETKEIVQVKDFFNYYHPQEIIQFLIQNEDKLDKDQTTVTITQANNFHSLFKESQMNFILNFQYEPETAKIFRKPFDEVSDIIKSSKAKLKKIKS